MVLSGVLAASMAVTGTAAEDQVTITYSLWDEIQSVVYQELIDNFEEQNPNIHVEMQLTPRDQYWTKFDASAGANQAADVFFMNEEEKETTEKRKSRHYGLKGFQLLEKGSCAERK